MAYVGKLEDGYQFDAANKFPFTLGYYYTAPPLDVWLGLGLELGF